MVVLEPRQRRARACTSAGRAPPWARIASNHRTPSVGSCVTQRFSRLAASTAASSTRSAARAQASAARTLSSSAIASSCRCSAPRPIVSSDIAKVLVSSRRCSARRRRSASASPLSSSRSTAYSRIVSSIQKRSTVCAEEALLDERLERVEVGVGDGLGRLERAAAGEDAEPGEEHLLLGVESRSCDHSIVARRVACRASASRPPLKRSSRSAEPLEDLLGRERFRPGGGELERKRHVVEPAAELRRSQAVGVEPRARGRRARPPPGRRAASTSYSTSPRTRSSSREVTSSVEVRACLEEGGQAPARPSTPARGCRARGASRARRRARRGRPGRRSSSPTVGMTSAGSWIGREQRPRRRRSWNSPTSSDGRLDREAGLPRAAGAGERDEPRPAARRSCTSATSRSRPTKLDAGRGRFVFEIVFSGGKGSSPELVDPDRLVEVLDAVLAEVAHRLAVEQIARRLRQQHLAAVAGRRDAGAEMDVDARPNPRRCASARRCARPSARARGRRASAAWAASAAATESARLGKREEEGVALRVHLGAAVGAERLAEHAPVLGEHRGVSIAELVQELASSPRRP